MRRRFGPPVRLEVERDIDPHVLDLLVRELGIGTAGGLRLPGPLDLTGLLGVRPTRPRPTSSYPAFLPRTSRDLADVRDAPTPDVLRGDRATTTSCCTTPTSRSRRACRRFLEQAATDPNVLAIKQTLYRTSGDSPSSRRSSTPPRRASRCSRSSRSRRASTSRPTSSWARKLEEAGCHVVYGLVGLKTHCKLALVVRQEGDRLRRYLHIGTGNYHPKTARLYEDLGLLTADDQVGDDVARLFNVLSGYSMETEYKRLLVAPHSCAPGCIERIEREVAQRRGRASPRASASRSTPSSTRRSSTRSTARRRPACRSTSWVRGICALRPGVPGLSENIRVRASWAASSSTRGIFAFANGGDPEVWIGSADLMHRNLDRRVEALVRLGVGRAHRPAWPGCSTSRSTRDEHLAPRPDGRWVRLHQAADGTPLVDVQSTLIARQARRSSTAS